jgi:hypothetical protein
MQGISYSATPQPHTLVHTIQATGVVHTNKKYKRSKVSSAKEESEDEEEIKQPSAKKPAVETTTNLVNASLCPFSIIHLPMIPYR